MDRRGVCRS